MLVLQLAFHVVGISAIECVGNLPGVLLIIRKIAGPETWFHEEIVSKNLA